MFIKVTMAGAAETGISDVGFVNMASVCAVTAPQDGGYAVLLMNNRDFSRVTETPEEIMALLEQARQQAQRPAAPHIITLPCQDSKVVCMDAAEFRSAQSAEYGSIVRYGGDKHGGGDRFAFCLLAPAEVVRLIRGEA